MVIQDCRSLETALQAETVFDAMIGSNNIFSTCCCAFDEGHSTLVPSFLADCILVVAVHSSL